MTEEINADRGAGDRPEVELRRQAGSENELDWKRHVTDCFGPSVAKRGFSSARKEMGRLTLVMKTRLEDGSPPDRQKTLARRDCSLFQDLFHRPDRRLHFFICVVKVRRHAHARLGPPIHHNFSLQQFAADFLRIGHID